MTDWCSVTADPPLPCSHLCAHLAFAALPCVAAPAHLASPFFSTATCMPPAVPGRCTNLYICAQSAAGVTLSSVAFKAAAGFVLLASTFDGRYATGQLPSLEDYGR